MSFNKNRTLARRKEYLEKPCIDCGHSMSMHSGYGCCKCECKREKKEKVR